MDNKRQKYIIKRKRIHPYFKIHEVYELHETINNNSVKNAYQDSEGTLWAINTTFFYMDNKEYIPLGDQNSFIQTPIGNIPQTLFYGKIKENFPNLNIRYKEVNGLYVLFISGGGEEKDRKRIINFFTENDIPLDEIHFIKQGEDLKEISNHYKPIHKGTSFFKLLLLYYKKRFKLFLFLGLSLLTLPFLYYNVLTPIMFGGILVILFLFHLEIVLFLDLRRENLKTDNILLNKNVSKKSFETFSFFLKALLALVIYYLVYFSFIKPHAFIS